MGVDKHASAHSELALLVVHEQKTVVPAISARLVHNWCDVTTGRIEVTHIQKRRVMLVSTPQQRPEFDYDFAFRRNNRWGTGAVHTLSIYYRGNELLFAGLRMQDKKCLIGRLFGQPLANVTQLCFVGARFFHQCEVLLTQPCVLLFCVSPARKVSKDFLYHIVKDRIKRIE